MSFVHLDSDLSTNKSKRLITLIYTLAFLMVFEGMIRKLLPSLGIVIFLLKDFLCLIGLYFILKREEDKRVSAFKIIVRCVCFLFIPVFLVTVLHEPLIAIFGLKQYLLYITIAFIFVYAFGTSDKVYFDRFVFIFTLLLIPTTFIATMQNILPPDHWLNQSVDGESLEAFAVNGVLRVSSTFSFTGQYSYYLNFSGAFLGMRFFVIEKKILNNVADNILVGLLAMCLIIGMFITGGRTAVFGVGATGFIALLLITYKQPKVVFQKAWIWLLAAFMLFGFMRATFPQFFEVYEQRQESDAETNELENRIVNSFFEESKWVEDLDFIDMLLGQGLGVMSNGSDKISDYASEIRITGFWTESDFQSTFWEGGLYLLAVWYGFRLTIIIFSVVQWSKLIERSYVLGGAFLVGFITVSALFSPLGIQNASAVWWWFGVGALLCLLLLDKKTI